jgi:hypothetical protein
MTHRPILFALAVALISAPAGAQQMHQHDAGEKTSAAGAYSPGLGEIMTLQQMRHSKLWFAGQARNWALAGYEIDELKEGFEDVAKLFPTVNGVSLTQVVASITANQIADLEKAALAKDRAKFIAAFDRLTAACNSCHQATQHGFIAIQRPSSLPYTNQTFAPPKGSASTPAHRH